MEKIIKKLKKIKINKIIDSEIDNIFDLNLVQDIKEGEKNINIIIDISKLNISQEQIKDLNNLLSVKLNSSFQRKKINIIFTASKGESVNKEGISDVKNEDDKKKIPFVKNIIVVASGKGGVGKSTLSVNLALSLSKIGYNIGLADADIYGPSIAHMMNLKDEPKIKDNIVYPIENYGIKSISIANLVQDKDQALIWRGPMITKALNQLIKEVSWGSKDEELDYLIIDTPPGTGDVQISISQLFNISGAIIVSTPQDLSTIDAVKVINMFEKINIPIIGLVQNMSYLKSPNSKEKIYLFGEDKAKELAKKKDINFLGDIPIDIRIRQSGDAGRSISYADPSSDIAFSYGCIAENVIDFFPK